MTTCEGGMITTDSDEEDFLARSHRNQGKRGMSYGGLHHDFGNSSRMTELGALLGSMQLKKLPQMIRKRQAAYDAITKKLDAAGIIVHAHCVNYRATLADEDIEKTFEQAKALGTNVIATSTQVTMMKRLAPVAEKHKIYVAFHGHSNTKDPNEFATPESFQSALDTSKYFKVNLDIGHFSAAGYDPVAYIERHHDRITHLHVKDRKKNDGPNMPWGQGDTPIKQVLLLLKDKKHPIPALVEYEYPGKGTVPEEVQKCLDFMRAALA